VPIGSHPVSAARAVLARVYSYGALVLHSGSRRGTPRRGQAQPAPDPERRWSYGVVLTLLETHLPNASDLFAPVPYFVAKAAVPAARSVLQDLAAAIVAAW
jgi:hypothetical protein